MSEETDGPQIPWQGIGAPLTLVPPGLQAMAASALFFSLMAALAKVAGRTVPLFEIVFARSVVVAVLSGAKLSLDGKSFVGREPGILVMRGVLGFGALTCFYYAVVHLPLADATVIHFMNPVFTAFFAAVVLGEHIGFVEALLVMVSLGGVLVVARPSFLFGGDGGLEPLAVIIGLCGAVLSAAAYVTVRRLRGEAPMLIVFYFAAVCTVLSVPMLLLHATMPSAGMMVVLLGVGVATHLGQVLITWGFRLERAGRASSVGYLQIVFAGFWGWVLFGEMPDLWTGLGAAIIVASTLALVRLHPVR
ncbi:MAG TPA: DMT family transporter [Longimicrobiales bacterium]|nr:DMT family transporter [Longimicrobiales bacterium]